MQVRLRPKARTATLETCPLCRDALTASTIHCPGCNTGYHPACTLELGGCALLGCGALTARSQQPRSFRVFNFPRPTEESPPSIYRSFLITLFTSLPLFALALSMLGANLLGGLVFAIPFACLYALWKLPVSDD